MNPVSKGSGYVSPAFCWLDSQFLVVTIPGAYHTLGDFMRTNGLRQAYEGVIPCFETDGESMDVYIACE